MPAATIRANYDQLKQVATTFGKSSDECKRSLQNIKNNKETLQGGDWVGQGARAFYKEMDDSVLPTLQRLISALDTAQNSISQISSIMQGAEQQAAKVLQGGSPGGSSGGSSGGAAGGEAAGGAAGAAGGGGSPSSGGSSGGGSNTGGAGGAAAGGAAAGGAAGGASSAANQITQLPKKPPRPSARSATSPTAI